jgi:superfamily I DNA/RNA helicase
MTIHNSKGLEFDSVIMLGVEKEAFFGKIADERAAYFVGISRAFRAETSWRNRRKKCNETYLVRWGGASRV